MLSADWRRRHPPGRTASNSAMVMAPSPGPKLSTWRTMARRTVWAGAPRPATGGDAIPVVRMSGERGQTGGVVPLRTPWLRAPA